MGDPWRWAGRAVVVAAALLAAAGARPYAGGWNDGSRLAAVESLAERGTFVIDDSVFVTVPPGEPSPYPPTPPGLRQLGTLDKLRINDHFYSDKSPVPTVLTAGLYRGWLLCGGPTVRERPDLVCWFLTVGTSGLTCVVAVWCVGRLGRVLGLAGRDGFLFTLAFAFATVAPAYTRHVNSHELFLAAAAVVTLGLAKARDGGWAWPAAVGTAAGFGYGCDLGVGPALLLCLAPAAVWLFRWRAVVVLAAAVPWLAAHHALNYSVGGTLLPANMVKEYLAWPGSPFTEDVMTGGLKHDPLGFVGYAADLVVGKKGFLLHNLPLWLAPGGAYLLLRYRPATRPAVLFAVGWAAVSLAVYAATSSNLGGQCCSVRWFVPLLAPGFWVVGLVLREFPRYRQDFAWLTGCGVVMAALMWWDGPWTPRMVPGLWGWVAAAGAGWVVIRVRDWRRAKAHPTPRVGLDVQPVTTRSSSAA